MTHDERRADIIAEAVFLDGTDHPDRIAQRLGYKNADSFGRVLHKWGRSDLARRYERVPA